MTDKAEIISEVKKIRNELYDQLPKGILNAFDLIVLIKDHIEKLDKLAGSAGQNNEV